MSDFKYSIRWFFFLLSQLQFEDTIVVVDDVGQGRESVVMVEATFLNLLRIEKRAQGFRAVTIMGRSLRLEIINPDFLAVCRFQPGRKIGRLLTATIHSIVRT
jgi:3-dehydroquinate synthase class II